MKRKRRWITTSCSSLVHSSSLLVKRAAVWPPFFFFLWALPGLRPLQPRADCVRIPEINLVQWPQVVVELIDERDTRRNIQLDDLSVRQIVQILHQRAEAVSVRGDEDVFPGLDIRGDRRLPVRNKACDSIFQRLA